MHPLAELLAEIGCADLDGSIRLEHGARNVSLFQTLARGFACPNARYRGFLDPSAAEEVDQQTLSRAPTSSPDFELALLQEEGCSEVDREKRFTNRSKRLIYVLGGPG